MKKTKRIAALLLALVMCIACFSACGEKKKSVPENPSEATSKSITNLFDRLEETSDTKLIDKIADSGYIKASINLKNILALASGGSFSSDLVVALDGVFGDAAASGSLGVTVGGTELVKASVYESDDGVALSVPALVSGAYGVSYDDIMSLFLAESPTGGAASNASVLATLGGELLTNAEKISDILKDYTEYLLETLIEKAAATRTEGSVTVGDESVEAIIISAGVTEQIAYDTLKDVYAHYKADAETKNFIDGIITDAGFNTEDIYTGIDSSLAELTATSSEVLNLSIAINKQLATLMQFKADMNGEGIVVTVGPDAAEPKYIEVSFSGNDETGSMTYKVTNDTDDQFASEATVVVGGDTVASIKYDNSRKTNEYSATVNVNNQGQNIAITISGTVESKKDSYKFSINKVSAYGMSIDVGFECEIGTTGKKPEKMPEFKDVTALSEADISALQSELMTNASTLISKLPEDLMSLVGMLAGEGR